MSLTRRAKQVGIFVAGSAVTLAGVAMLVLPGPGLLVIVGGLSILAVEFAWARQLRDQAQAKAASAAAKAKERLKKRR